MELKEVTRVDPEAVRLGAASHGFVSVTREGREAIRVGVSAISEVELYDLMAEPVRYLARVLRDPDDFERPWGTADELRDALVPAEVDSLFREAQAHQRKAVPSFTRETVEKFLDEVRESDRKNVLLCYRAAHAANLSGYYGTPAMLLTDGQVLYFMGLMTAYNERMKDLRDAARDPE